MSTQPTEDNGGSPILSRPRGQLLDYPLQYRWEITRRHPYYLTFWHHALLYRRGEVGENDKERLLRYAAIEYLGAIGVFGEPVDPNKGFKDLDASVDPAFVSCAVQPQSLRATVAMLINALPQAERAVIGAILQTSSSQEYALPGDDETLSLQRHRALLMLMQIASPPLDSYPDAPLFFIHLGASQRTIVSDMVEQVRRRKARLGIEERRIHTAKLAAYLKVWDLREGWSGGGYQKAVEKNFEEVASLLHMPTSTVFNQYRAAFRLVTGHEFSPAIWLELLGPFRLGDPARQLAKRVKYRLQSKTDSQSIPAVVDSVVSPKDDNEHRVGIVESMTVGSEASLESALEYRDFMIDFRDFVERGLNDDEIARRLEVSEIAVVRELRDRLAEFADY